MLLDVREIEASYGLSQILFGVSLAIGEGEVVTLMGRNGMGKTTTVSSIMGLLTVRGGQIDFANRRIDGLPPHRIARLGAGLVPEGRRIFPNLTVEENLQMARIRRGAEITDAPWTLERVYELFPRLRERYSSQGTRLSGGEQQMLAIGRALMTNPRLLILDEATEGLAPVIRDEIWACLSSLKLTGLSILVIDKEVEALCRIADRHYLLEKGQIAWTGTTAELMAAPSLHETYLGI
ncbi:ABC transporter ATP-binding protein [Rhizobium sp. P28RR-XV]|uniref:ABC transporter ATP-binding protein n=1 Tax=Rhizobium sp. P28RR-XV TaxID=2726737 RepID=UPI0014564616|nr:ABC transporter ATP-binding protein [Rhizobium sp. P28RR-XV]NLR88192.1 ABC transporter ATP-binding protein [Rhizobium sp. P28RR-XV]